MHATHCAKAGISRRGTEARRRRGSCRESRQVSEDSSTFVVESEILTALFKGLVNVADDGVAVLPRWPYCHTGKMWLVFFIIFSGLPFPSRA